MEHDGTVAAVDNRVTDEELAARVSRGMDLLDKREPGWWREDREHPIDLTHLHMWSTHACLLGQLGGYWAMQAKLGIDGTDADGAVNSAPYGFSLTNEEWRADGDATYGRLGVRWTAAIVGRRQEASTR